MRKRSLEKNVKRIISFIALCVAVAVGASLWISYKGNFAAPFSETLSVDITDDILNPDNLKDFALDGNALTSMTDDPWILLDTAERPPFGCVEMDMRAIDENGLQMFWADAGEAIDGSRAASQDLKSGKLVFSLPLGKHERIRLDIANIAGARLAVLSANLYDKRPFGMKQFESVAVASLVICALLYFLFFHRGDKDLY
jgi:hypothetical protein